MTAVVVVVVVVVVVDDDVHVVVVVDDGLVGIWGGRCLLLLRPVLPPYRPRGVEWVGE